MPRFGIPTVGKGMSAFLTPEVTHIIGKDKTQRIERTNGIIRQQTGRWHRRQNKFGKLWEQTKVTTSVGGQLFQLDMETQSNEEYSCSKGWISLSDLVMARYRNLSHTLLRHDHL